MTRFRLALMAPVVAVSLASCGLNSVPTAEEQVNKAWGDVQLTPTTYVVNKRGQIVKRYVGEPDFAELHQLIEKLLAEA